MQHIDISHPHAAANSSQLRLGQFVREQDAFGREMIRTGFTGIEPAQESLGQSGLGKIQDRSGPIIRTVAVGSYPAGGQHNDGFCPQPADEGASG
ncbi:MAG: hypothetical protein ACRDNT_08170 [Streptosporangiaceae bacterium]